MQFFRQARLAFHHLVQFNKNKTFFTKELTSNPRLSALITDISLARPRYRLRFLHYFLLTVLMGEWVALLHGRWLSTGEKRKLLWLSAAISIADDWFDDLSMPVDDILTRLTEPSRLPAQSTEEKLVKELMMLVFEQVPDDQRLIPFITDFWQAEKASVEQMTGKLSGHGLFMVSVTKSYNTVLLCRQLIELPVLENEGKALWEISATGQVMDDVLDLYDDFHEGVKTPATENPDMLSLCRLSNQQVVAMVQSVRAVKTSVFNQDQVISSLSFMPAVLKLALNQFKSVQTSDSRLPLETVDRKLMICDLDDPLTLIRLTWIFLTINTEHPQAPVCS